MSVIEGHRLCLSPIRIGSAVALVHAREGSVEFAQVPSAHPNARRLDPRGRVGLSAGEAGLLQGPFVLVTAYDDGAVRLVSEGALTRLLRLLDEPP